MRILLQPGQHCGTVFQRRLAHWQRLAWYFQGPGLSAAPKISIKIKLEGFLMHPNKGQNSCSICSPGQIPLKITGPSQRLQKTSPIRRTCSQSSVLRQSALLQSNYWCPQMFSPGISTVQPPWCLTQVCKWQTCQRTDCLPRREGLQ